MKRNRLFLGAAALMTALALNAETVVYLNDSGSDSNDGATPETAVSSLTRAFNLIPTDDGGTVVLNGKFTQSANFVPTVPRNGTIKFTQVYDGVDYRGDNHTANAWTLTTGVRFALITDVVFENVTFHMAAQPTYPFFLVISNYNSITVGEGCEMTGFFKWSELAASFSILGGCQDNTNNVKAGSDYNPNITVKSGDVLIVAYNRGGKATSFPVTKDNRAHVNIEGGCIHGLYIGSVGNGAGGCTTVKISGGEFAKYGTMTSNGRVAGDGKTMILDLSALDRNGQYAVAEYNDLRMYEEVISDIKIPVKEFASGTTTLSDGSEMPYRYYTTPATTPDEPKRLVLFMHGAGSRGADNSLQLSSLGAAPIYPLSNEIGNAIILAPQVPSAERWVTLTGGYHFDSEGTIYLEGAKALARQYAAENGVEPENMYAVGSSNGAAGIWAILNSEDNPFARVIPISGYGETSTETEGIIERIGQKHVWAFHGTADATVLVNGMQVLAPKLAEADKNFKYTEVEGADHSTIWRIASMTPGFCEFLTAPDDQTGISNTVVAAPSVKVSGNTVIVEAACAAIYSIAGVEIASKNGSDSVKVFDGLAAGAYIVKADGCAVKVLVK